MSFPDVIGKLPSKVMEEYGIRIHYTTDTENKCQVAFIEVTKDNDSPEHKHCAQYSVVLSGQADVTIGGVSKTYKKGDTYFIPEGVAHSSKIYAGYKAIEYFSGIRIKEEKQ